MKTTNEIHPVAYIEGFGTHPSSFMDEDNSSNSSYGSSDGPFSIMVQAFTGNIYGQGKLVAAATILSSSSSSSAGIVFE